MTLKQSKRMRTHSVPREPTTTGQSVVDAVVDSLRERIATRSLPPGSKLPEVELASAYGVSRAKIREALSILEQRRLIERIPNRGAIVSRLEPEHVYELLNIREMLEGLCVRFATQNASPESWQEFVDLFGEPMEQIIENEDYEAYVTNLHRLRMRMIKAAASPILADLLNSLDDQTQELSRRLLLLPGRAEQGLKEHRAMLAAMRQGEAHEAEELRRQNMRSAIEYFRRHQSFLL